MKLGYSKFLLNNNNTNVIIIILWIFSEKRCERVQFFCLNFFLQWQNIGAQPQKLMRTQQLKVFFLMFLYFLGAGEQILIFILRNNNDLLKKFKNGANKVFLTHKL